MNKKGLFVLPTSEGGGGISSVAKSIAAYFNEKNIDVDFVFLNGVNDSDFQGISEINTKFFLQKQNNKILHRIVVRHLFSQFAKKHGSYDFVLAFGFLPAILATRKFKNVVVTQHSSLYGAFPSYLSNYYLYQIKNSYPKAKAVITVSKEMELQVNDFFKKEIAKTIYNPIDFEGITQQSTGNVELNSEDYFLFVGRLDNNKQPMLIIKAFSDYLLREGQIKKLVLIGSGPLRDAVASEIEELKLRDYVLLLGQIESPYSWMKSASALLLASKFEGFGNVLVESLAVSTPVISFNSPTGPNEIINSGEYRPEKNTSLSFSDNGILVNEFSEADYSDALVAFDKMRQAFRPNADFMIQDSLGKYLDLVINNE
ncbi:glycosyltransferase [Weissella confusa]|uniref:glycosyltransferase n=1 Tax=Weissella confusa TaxID=1583 RepID=UPI0022E8BAED|nr:glycosyltransferase [Weissella confusa]